MRTRVLRLSLASVAMICALGLRAHAVGPDLFDILDVEVSRTPDHGHPSDFLASTRPDDRPRLQSLIAAHPELGERLDVLSAEAAPLREGVERVMDGIWSGCATTQPSLVTGPVPRARGVLTFASVRKASGPLPIEDLLQVFVLLNRPFPSGVRPDGTPTGRDFVHFGYFPIPRRIQGAPPWSPMERAAFIREVVARRDVETTRITTDFAGACGGS